MPMEMGRAACHLDEPAVLVVDAKGSPPRSTPHWQVQTFVRTWEESRADWLAIRVHFAFYVLRQPIGASRLMEVFLIRVCVCVRVIREDVFFCLIRKIVY